MYAPKQNKIASILDDGPKSPAQLKKELARHGIPTKSLQISKLLVKMMEDGRIKRIEHGIYALPNYEPR